MNFEEFNGQNVVLTTKKNSMYYGLLKTRGYDTKHVLLKNLCILHKDGTTKAKSGVSENRLFSRDNITNISVE